MKGSQEYRAQNADQFRKIGEGVYGGYRKGVPNGPEATTKRGARRKAKRASGG